MSVISTSLTVPGQPSPRFHGEAWLPFRNREMDYYCKYFHTYIFLMTLWKIFAVDTQFKQLRKRSLKKKFKLQRNSNPWPLRYRRSALPTELWSHNCWEQVNFSGFIMPLRVVQHYSDWVCNDYTGPLWITHINKLAYTKCRFPLSPIIPYMEYARFHICRSTIPVSSWQTKWRTKAQACAG